MSNGARELGQLLRQCTASRSLAEGRRLHARVAECYPHDTVLGNLVVHMYGRCGRMEEAWHAFESMQCKNRYSWNMILGVCQHHGQLERTTFVFHRTPQWEVVSWGCIISAYVRHGQLIAAKGIFDTMPERGVVSWNTLCAAFAQNGHLVEAKRVFNLMSQRDRASWNTMLQALANRGHVEQAKALLETMPEPDIISWTTVIAAHAQKGHLEEAKALFDRTPSKDGFCWATMLVAFAKAGNVDLARKMLDRMPGGTLVAWNALIGSYEENGQLDEAKNLFEQCPDVNAVSCNAMIRAYARRGYMEDAKRVFDNMSGSDVVTWTTMIGAYSLNDQVEEAREMFDKMPQPNLVSWNSIITVYAHRQMFWDAFELFKMMVVEGVTPDETTFVTMLYTFGALTLLKEGRIIHLEILARGMLPSQVEYEEITGNENPYLGNAIMGFYGKCARMDEARAAFDKMALKNVVSWNGLASSYARNGYTDEALAVLCEMVLDGVTPNDVTFINLLSACSHAGLRGWDHFVSMANDHGVAPAESHYHCMIDLLGRSGQLIEAGELIKMLPFDARVLTWKILLAACNQHSESLDDHGALAANQLFMLDPQNPQAYVLLSNMHAISGGGALYG